MLVESDMESGLEGLLITFDYVVQNKKMSQYVVPGPPEKLCLMVTLSLF